MKKQQVRPKKRKPVQTAARKPPVNRLVWFVLPVFLLWMALIGARLVHLQTGENEWLAAKAAAQRFRERKSKPLRGAILDRNGRELAITLELDSLAVDPVNLENLESDAFQLAKILNKNPKELILQLTDARQQNRQYFPLERELEPAIVEKIKGLNIAGLVWTKEQKRQYPNQTLAAHVIGFTNREDFGQAGIEAAQEKNLRGDYTVVSEERDGSGRVFERMDTVTKLPRSVVLTIDSAIQYRVEQALQNGINATKAKAGAAVVINPKTGEILAMANAPAFDLNDLGNIKQDSWANRAVQNFYEPGSTFKLVAYSAALETGEVSIENSIDASAGAIKIGSRTIRDTGRAGILDLPTALAKSSNVAAITLGQRLGKERLFDYVRKFGFGAPTGVELPVESRGMLSAPGKWTIDTMGSIPIGYEIGVTTLQSAAAYGTIANDGVRVQPRIIKELREENGEIVPPNPVEARRVVSEKTAAQMRSMLSQVVERGTAKRARLDGYTAAGKTGTAHKYDPETRRYSGSKFVASFVGFAPAQNPQVAIAVMIDEPQAGTHHGGEAAAPVFREIAEQVLPELHIQPDAARAANQTLIAKQTADDEPANDEPTTLISPFADDKIIPAKIEKTAGDAAVKNQTKSNDAKQSAKTDDNKVVEKPLTNEKKNEKPVSSETRERTVEPKKNQPKPDAPKPKPPNEIKPKPQILNATIKTKAESPPKNQTKPKGKT